MKQILRIGEGYGLSPVKRYVLFILLIHLYIILLPGNSAQAQVENKSSVPKSTSGSEWLTNGSSRYYQDSLLKRRKQEVRDRAVIHSVKKLEIPEGGIVIADTLPAAFWDLCLYTLDTGGSKRLIFMGDYKRSLLILDFWGSGCKPCIESVDVLDSIQQKFGRIIGAIAINVFDAPGRAEKIREERGWKLPLVIGKGDTLLNKLFYTYANWGQVWIKDGKLLAIPTNAMLREDVLAKIITNRPVDIEMNDQLTYFDKRYNGKDTEPKPKNQTK
ncbi:hypothetical protein SAMN05216436_12078 [bacterium A37T11]|nr:hypothetical protein SAMN05216436_12078 [bacterium A37T11]